MSPLRTQANDDSMGLHQRLASPGTEGETLCRRNQPVRVREVPE